MDMCTSDGYKYGYGYMQYIPYRLHVNYSLGITNRGGEFGFGLDWVWIGEGIFRIRKLDFKHLKLVFHYVF